MAALELPPSLDFDREPHRELQRTKQRIAQKPNLRAATWLFEVQRLGVCLHALGRDDEALALSRWLGDAVPFQGNYDHWVPAGFARCLASRILRGRGDAAGARAAVAPIEATDLYAVFTDDAVRERQRGLAEEVRGLVAERDSKLTRLKLQWPLAGLVHLRETADLALPHAPQVDRGLCDEALAVGVAILGRWLAAKG